MRSCSCACQLSVALNIFEAVSFPSGCFALRWGALVCVQFLWIAFGLAWLAFVFFITCIAVNLAQISIGGKNHGGKKCFYVRRDLLKAVLIHR